MPMGFKGLCNEHTCSVVWYNQGYVLKHCHGINHSTFWDKGHPFPELNWDAHSFIHQWFLLYVLAEPRSFCKLSVFSTPRYRGLSSVKEVMGGFVLYSAHCGVEDAILWQSEARDAWDVWFEVVACDWPLSQEAWAPLSNSLHDGQCWMTYRKLLVNKI